METTEVQKIRTKVITDITCDCCGASCKVDETEITNEIRIDHGEMSRSFEFMKLEASWGYHSKKDMVRWTAHICEKCVDEKFGFIKFSKSPINFATRIK